MKLKLNNRAMQIPGGLGFYLPEVRWKARQGSSFDTIVRELQAVIAANPALAQKHNWPTNTREVEDWVELYNATVCQRMGWTNYIGAQPSSRDLIPKASPLHQQASLDSLRSAAARARELMEGAKTLKEWDESGDPAVPPELSLARAQACSKCPHNQPGNFTEWFTVAASELIKSRIERAQSRKLTTPQDDNLNLCDICHCPLKLKVHVPMPWITKRLSPDKLAALRAVPGCWVGTEG